MRPLRAGDPQRLGRFVLLARLGEGGMGEVYLARDPAGTLAAVKVVPCAFTPAAGPAARPVSVPQVTRPARQGRVQVTVGTNSGDLRLTLDRAQAPCAVEDFLHLVSSGYFDDTPCHRLVRDGLFALQCGDPTGTGTGGPGYTVNGEYPARLDTVPGSPGTVVYPRGVVAMATSGQLDSTGSQFFFVYSDSSIGPDYPVLGSVDEGGLAVLDQIAAAGDDGSSAGGGGIPRRPVTIVRATIS